MCQACQKPNENSAASADELEQLIECFNARQAENIRIVDQLTKCAIILCATILALAILT